MKPMSVTVLITNISKEAIQISDKSMEIEYVEDGKTLGWHSRWTEDEIFIEIGVGETYEMKLENKRLFEFYTTYKERQAVESFTFGVNAIFECNDATPRKKISCNSTNTLDIEIDYTSVEILKTPSGEDSCYMNYNGEICYLSKYSRAYEKAVKKLSIDKQNYEILDDTYIIDDKKVFRDGNLQRIKPDGFRVYNALFAGNDEMVLTSYGNAKVKDPKSFEAFDVYGDAYKKGYARDKEHLYFFDEGGGTHHARIVKACKNPLTFKPLYALSEKKSYGKGLRWELFGQCERTVYIDAASISLCESASWQRMGRFSKDRKNAFYFTYKLKDVDAESFELIPDAEQTETYNTLEKSRWAKDKNNYYNCSHVSSEGLYKEAIEKALEAED